VNNFLYDIQDAVVARLQSPECFGAAEIPPGIIAERLGDLTAQIEAGLTNAGCNLVIATPGYEATGERLEDGLGITIVVSIHERPSINRGVTGTGADYLQTAVYVIAGLCGWSPGPGYSPIRLEGGSTITTGGDGGDLQHEVRLMVGAMVARSNPE
jgi:hypothetical protein